MEFLMDFKKTSISKNVGKFLQDNLKDEKDKESLQNIITEKALLKNDAFIMCPHLITCILFYSIFLNDKSPVLKRINTYLLTYLLTYL